MAHIFFEPLQQRKNPQSLFGGSWFPGLNLGNFQIYAVSIPPEYSRYVNPNPWSTPSYLNPMWSNTLTTPWSGSYAFSWPVSYNLPWSNPLNSFYSPWTNTFNFPWLSPFGFSWLDPRLTDPGFHAWGPPPPMISPCYTSPPPPDENYRTCYLVGPIDTSSLNLETVKKVRESLIAFFQNKGILSNRQMQRLLSSFERA